MIPFPEKRYSVIYADPPWAYVQNGGPKGKRGMASAHYETMSVDDICNLPVRKITGGGAVLFLWATFPNIAEALRVMQAWGFAYKTAAFVWVKKNRKSGTNFWGLGQYTRANAEVCLIGISKGFKAGEKIKSHRVHQIVEAPFDGHSKKPDIVRERIVELMGNVPRIELFARDRVPGWDAWGDELPEKPVPSD